MNGLSLGFVFGWMFGWVFGIVPGCVLGFVPGTEGPVLALSIVVWRSRWKKFAATWNLEEEQGRVLLVAGVPGGSGMGPPGTEGENWDGSVRGGSARWKGKVFQVERKVEYGYGRSFYRFTQIMAIRNNGSPRFRIRNKGFESVFFSGTSYSSCFCRARCRS